MRLDVFFRRGWAWDDGWNGGQQPAPHKETTTTTHPNAGPIRFGPVPFAQPKGSQRGPFFFSLLLLLLAWVKASAFVRRAASTHAQWHGTGPGREGGGGLSLPGLSILGPGRPRGYSLSQSQEWSPSCQPVHPSIGGVTRYVCAMQTVSEIFSMPVGCVPSKLLLSARQACTRVNNMHGVTPSYFASRNLGLVLGVQ